MNKIAIHQIRPQEGNIQPSGTSPVSKRSGIFQNLLERSIAQSQGFGITFSSHALERLHTRNIMLSADDVARLNSAVNRAGEKGSRESLVLLNNMAFIVNVKNKTVVTAMTRDQMHENVITNIDSMVLV